MVIEFMSTLLPGTNLWNPGFKFQNKIESRLIKAEITALCHFLIFPRFVIPLKTAVRR